jgi:glycosyltransferase involved in cell wall biosynthesis
LVLIGEGPEKEKVLNYVKQNHLSNVSFEGLIEEEQRIAEHLQNSHALLLPSLFESFSLSALEAQACGVPVIASNVGGIPELIIDGQTGYLSDPGDVAHFADNIRLILDDKGKWTQLSRCAEANGRQYASGTVIERYLELYKR